MAIDTATLLRILGDIFVLHDLAHDVPIDRTHLIDFEDANPRRIKARTKEFPSRLTAQEIVDEFSRSGSWPQNAPSFKNEGTRIDLDISKPGSKEYALVAFRVSKPDRFIDLEGKPTFAITGGLWGKELPKSYLFHPRWVPEDSSDYDIVSMIVAGSKYETQYNLGIQMKDKEGDFMTPIFIDPKIENGGG